MSTAPSMVTGDALDAESILKLYACAIATTAAFFDELSRGEMPSFAPLKRVAQQLSSASASGSSLMRAIVSLAPARRDVPARAVQSAVLSLLAAHQVAVDRTTLCRLAEAAMLVDAGSVRLAGNIDGRLPRHLEAEVPAATAVACLQSGDGNSEVAQTRATIAFEAAWLERAGLLGPLRGSGVGPLLGARLIVMVRALLSRLAPPDGGPGVSPPEALCGTAQAPGSDPVLMRLLVAALGALPVSTVVELDTGEWAVVAAPPSDPIRMDQPRVRVVTDARGRAKQPPSELDLAVGPRGSLASIRRIVPPDEARFNVARALFA